MQEFKALLENIKSVNEFLTPIVLGYVVLMGLAMRWGKRHWFARETQRRADGGQAALRFVGGGSDDVLPWKDMRVLKGGFFGALLVLLLFTYVLFMLLLGGPASVAEMLRQLGVLTAYPNLMLAAFALLWVYQGRAQYPWKSQWLFLLAVVLGIGLTVGAVAAAVWQAQTASSTPQHHEIILALQTLALVIESLCLSYTLGATTGIRDADPLRLPLVEVTLVDDEVRQLRLYQKEATEYRLVDATGVECVIPMHRVVLLRPVAQPG